MLNSSINVHFVRAALVHASEQNVDITSLLERSKISPNILGLKDARVSARQYAHLQVLTMLAMDDEFVGHTPNPVVMGSWSAMCHWLINTRTLNQVIRRFCRFYLFLGRGFNPKLKVLDNIVIVEMEPWSKADEYGLYAFELFLFTFHRLLCWMTREKIPIHKVHIPFVRPAHHREYQYLFYEYPVYFDQQNCSISFHKAILNLPIRQTAQTLNELLRNPLYEFIVQDYDQTSWAARVMRIINREPSENNALPEIARKLGTNAHTLRRRLADEGQSFVELKQEVKRDLAIHYLSGTASSVEEIAFKTGFSEASAFIRAFKKWTGVTPYTYRKQR